MHRIITQFLERDAPSRAGVPAMRRDRRRAYEQHSGLTPQLRVSALG